MVSALVKYKTLDWALRLNPKLREMIIGSYANKPRYLNYLNKLITSIRKSSTGIQKKVKDADLNFNKFRSTVSEFEIGRILVSRGKRVKFLEDTHWQGKSPDMVSIDNKQEIYVEVKRLEDDEVVGNLLNGLREFLSSPMRCYRVDVNLDADLTIPVTKHNERQKKEDLAQASLEEFKRKFAKSDLSKLPAAIRTAHAEFHVSASGLDFGYPGVITSVSQRVPEHKLEEKLVFDLCTKATKRVDWQGDALRKKYIVAIDVEQPHIDERTVVNALYGKVVFMGVLYRGSDKVTPARELMPKSPPSTEVAHAIELGWGDFLLDRCLIANQGKSKYLPEENKGAYFTRDETKHVSAVLVRFRTDSFSWLPNPFAYDEINDPSIVAYLQ